MRLALFRKIQLAQANLDKLEMSRDNRQHNLGLQVCKLGSGATSGASLIRSEGAVGDVGGVGAEPALGSELVLGLSEDLGVSLNDVGSRAQAETVDNKGLAIGQGDGVIGTLRGDTSGGSGRMKTQGLFDDGVGV